MTEKINELDKIRGIFGLYESFATEEEYRASKCLSYSILKDLHDNPEILTKEKKHIETEWFSFGTLVDMMLTSPEDFDNKVFVNDRIPSETFKSIADYMITNNLGVEGIKEKTEGWESTIKSIYTNSGSDVKWLPETMRQKLLDNCIDYIKLLTEHKDKLIVTTEMFLEAQRVSEMLKSHSWSKTLFMSAKEQLANHIEIFYQFKIKYIYEGIKCKSMLDIVIIDHDQKTITPVDLKTGSDYPRYFINHALFKYKYGYQGVLYKEGLIKFISNLPEFKEYDVENFKFVYVSRPRPTFPVVLEMGSRCHMEFRDLGIENGLYDIPALTDIINEAGYYIGQIDEGLLPTVPYDLIRLGGIFINNGSSINDLVF